MISVKYVKGVFTEWNTCSKDDTFRESNPCIGKVAKCKVASLRH